MEKMLVKLICSRLESAIAKAGDPNQLGFRKAKSTMALVLQLPLFNLPEGSRDATQLAERWYWTRCQCNIRKDLREIAESYIRRRTQIYNSEGPNSYLASGGVPQ